MKKVIMALLPLVMCATSLFGADYHDLSKRDHHQVEVIDSQIQSLEDLKVHYLAKAKRLQNRGNRNNFVAREKNPQESEKDWQSAEGYVKIADQIQDQIDKLEEEKATILSKY